MVVATSVVGSTPQIWDDLVKNLECTWEDENGLIVYEAVNGFNKSVFEIKDQKISRKVVYGEPLEISWWCIEEATEETKGTGLAMPEEAVVVTGPWLFENPTNDEDLGYVKDWVITDTTLSQTEEMWTEEAFEALKKENENSVRMYLRIKALQVLEPTEDVDSVGKLHCFGLFHGQAPKQHLYYNRLDSFLWLTVSFRRHEIKMQFDVDSTKGVLTSFAKIEDSDLQVWGGIDVEATISESARRFAGGFDKRQVTALSQARALARLTKELMAEHVYSHRLVEDRQPPKPRINKRGIFKKR